MKFTNDSLSEYIKNGKEYSEIKFYNIIQSINIPIILIGKNNEIQYMNSAALDLIISIFKDCKEPYENNKCIEKLNSIIEVGLEKINNNNILRYNYKVTIEIKNRKRHLKIELSKTLNHSNYEDDIIVTLKDITDHCLAEEFIERSMSATKVISNINSSFIGIFNMEEAVNNTLKKILEVSNADRVYIFELNENCKTMDNTYECCKKGVTSQIDNLKNLPVSMFPWWMKQLYSNKVINVADVSQIPEEGKQERELLESQDIKSLLVVPLKIKDRLIGYLGIDNIKEKGKWSSYIYMLMRLVGSILSNVYESKEAERELIESEKKFRELFNRINAAIFVHKVKKNSLSYNYVMVNDYACKLLGYTRKELLNMSPNDNVRKEESNYVKGLIKQIIEKGQLTFEIDFITKNRQIIPVEVISHVCVLNNEKMIMSIARDISYRKKAEEEIRKLHRAIEHSSSVVVITNFEGDIEYVNPKFTKLTGYKSNEVIGKKYHFFQSGKQVSQPYNELWDTITSGNDWSGELQNIRKNDEIYWVLTSISPIKNDNGIVTHFIAISEDITERKLMEEQIRKRNNELNDTLEKLKLAQQQLIHQEKMAGIGQLAAGVAHEINNPLGYVLSNFGTLKKYINVYDELFGLYRRLINNIEELNTDNLSEYIKRIRRNEKDRSIEFISSDLPELLSDSEDGLDRIGKIVKGLRLFSRMDNQDCYEEYDLNEGIQNVLLIANNEIKYNADVEIKLKLIPYIDALPNQINQVLLNIIVNAGQAIKEKSNDSRGIINIKTYAEEDHVICEIEDNGIGIPEENINQIFNPFFTTKPVGYGTGLGLSISYDIIKNKHNGEIEVQSIPNVGTKFVIKIPIKQPRTSSY